MAVTINGSAGVTTNSGAVYNGLQTDTAKASTSGTSVDFTGIPSWVKRITLMYRGLSMAAAGVMRIRVGTSSGLVTSGYETRVTGLVGTPSIAVSSVTDGLGGSGTSSGATTLLGTTVITQIDTNVWVASGGHSRVGDDQTQLWNGYIALAGTLDRLSVVATTSTFDAGTINIIYE